jgi:hypothetical protein
MLLHGKLSTGKGFLQLEKITPSKHSITGEGAPRSCMIYDICDTGKGDLRAKILPAINFKKSRRVTAWRARLRH